MISTLSQRIRNAVSKGVKDTSGTATIEAALWIPFIFAVFGIIVNVSFIFHGRSQVYRVMQDANRAISTGRYNEALTAEYVKKSLINLAPNATVTTSIGPDTGVATTVVKVPTYDFMAVGVMGIQNLFNFEMTMSSSHMVEYYPVEAPVATGTFYE